MKRQPNQWENIFADHTSDKALIPKIHKLMELNSKKNKKTTTKRHSTRKWAEDLNRHFSKEDTQVVKRYMQRCFTTLIIRKMQIKTSRLSPHACQSGYYQKDKIMSLRIWRKGNPCAVSVGIVSWCSHHGKQYGGSSKN